MRLHRCDCTCHVRLCSSERHGLRCPPICARMGSRTRAQRQTWSGLSRCGCPGIWCRIKIQSGNHDCPMLNRRAYPQCRRRWGRWLITSSLTIICDNICSDSPASSPWHCLRPLLIPLYKAFRRIPTTVVGMDHVTFQSLVQQLDDQLQLTASLTHRHQSLQPGITLVRIANSNVQTLDEVGSLHIKSRRIWVGILDPTSPHRKLDEEVSDALLVWSQLLVSTPFSLSICSSVQIPIQATAGGAAFFNDGSSVWFQFRIHLDEARALWPWIGSAKTCKNTLLPGNCLRNLSCPFTSTPYWPEPADQWCHQATDNSAADAASAKGLTMTRALALVLARYFTFMRRFQVFPHLTHTTCWLMNWVASECHCLQHWIQLRNWRSHGETYCALQAFKWPKSVESGHPTLTFDCEKKAAVVPWLGASID